MTSEPRYPSHAYVISRLHEATRYFETVLADLPASVLARVLLRPAPAPLCWCTHLATTHDLGRPSKPCSITRCPCTGYAHTLDEYTLVSVVRLSVVEHAYPRRKHER